MDTTLARVLALPSLGLRLVAGGTDVARPVRWVAVSELVDPTPYLEGGEILLTTGMNLHAERTSDLDAYVERLAERGVVALGVAVGLTHQEVPPALVAAADRSDLPVFEVPPPTPFIAVTRAVADLIAETEQEAVRRSLERQRSLTRAAMRPHAVQSVVRELARILDGHVLVVTAKGEPLEESGRHLVSVEIIGAEVRRLRPKGLRSAASTSIGGLRVQVLPLGTSGRPQRYVGIATAGAVPDKGVVSTAVSLLSLAHERADSAAETATRLRQEVGRLLLEGDVATADSVLAAVSGSSLPERVVVVCAEGRDGVPGETLEDLGPLVHAALPDGAVALFTAPGEADAVVMALSDAGLRVGVSRSVTPAGASTGFEEARQALVHLATAPGEVGRFDDLLRRGVAALVDGSAARAWAQATLAPLREHAQGTRGVDLVASLEVYLAHHGQWHPAAAELGIHRHTLRYRIRLVEQLLGVSLDSAQVRMDLWFALQTAP